MYNFLPKFIKRISFICHKREEVDRAINGHKCLCIPDMWAHTSNSLLVCPWYVAYSPYWSQKWAKWSVTIKYFPGTKILKGERVVGLWIFLGPCSQDPNILQLCWQYLSIWCCAYIVELCLSIWYFAIILKVSLWVIR